MPTYAVLGGTGKIGRELVAQLSEDSENILHIYARSQAKLLDLHPSLADPTSRHKVYIGGLDDADLFADCIAGTSVVFGVVGTNINYPECHVAQDLAKVIIAAVGKLRNTSRNGAFKPPTVLYITSAGVTSDERVRANFPSYLHWMLQRVGKYVYEDFRHAVALFKQSENQWIPVIFVCAPGLETGPSQGKVYAGVNIPKNAPLYVTYTDLAKGMIQVAIEPDQLIHKDIGIAGAKQPPMHYKASMYNFSTNLMCVWTPPLWRFGYRRGWWGEH